MKRLLAPLLSAGLAVAPQTAEAGPVFFPGIKNEILQVFREPGVRCAELTQLEDRTLWICTGNDQTLTLTEPHAFLSERNPVRMETSTGYTLSYHDDVCVLDRPKNSFLGDEQYVREKKCRALGVLVRSMVTEALDSSEDQKGIL